MTVTRETESQRVFEQLKALILQQHLPAGAPLSHSQLCRDLQTSRTPVREALSKLEGIGLVKTIPHRGTFIAQLGLQDFLEITQIRALLEPFAARQAVGRIPIDALDDVERRLHMLDATNPSNADFEALHALDAEVHKLVGRAGGNRRLNAIAETSRNLCEQFSYDSRLRFGTMIAELLELLAVLRAGDGNAAEAVMRQHIQHFGEALPGMIDNHVVGADPRVRPQ